MQFHAQELGAPVSRGDYVVKIASVAERMSLSDNPLAEVSLEVLEGAFTGRIIGDHFVTGGPNERAVTVGRRRLVRLCRLCNLDLQPGRDVSLDELVGHVLVATVFEDTYEGMPVARVRSYRALRTDDPTAF